MRKEYDIIAYGEYQPILEEDKSIFAYIRRYKDEMLLVISNFYDKEKKVDLSEFVDQNKYKTNILISNYKDSSKDMKNIHLRAYESIVYHLVK